MDRPKPIPAPAFGTLEPRTEMRRLRRHKALQRAGESLISYRVCESIFWFLPHSDAVHGEYPVDREDELLHQLRQQMEGLWPGHILQEI